ncbi:XYLT-like protein [Mya arenaria]|uniref:XYLT-like protein n=1 Tax=Mya arenaria TaxID=6604 RepID=A0ABY7FSS5_MYAAR|nr:XYLT-like protein [Mya arenaria]
MTDFYNAFLVAKVLKLAPDHVTVFIVDGHPAGALDDTWSRLFGGMIRAGEITEAVTIQRMVWSTIGYDSMLNSHHLHQVPFLEEFRSFFLSRHSLHFNDALDCDNLTMSN